LNGDARHLECSSCPAILSVPPRALLLPAMLLILLGPPVAKAVQEGWFGVGAAVAGGFLLLFAGLWLGYAISPVRLVELRGRGAAPAQPQSRR
jgi:hypothetical protein